LESLARNQGLVTGHVVDNAAAEIELSEGRYNGATKSFRAAGSGAGAVRARSSFGGVLVLSFRHLLDRWSSASYTLREAWRTGHE
jgi:hypothetical protein